MICHILLGNAVIENETPISIEHNREMYNGKEIKYNLNTATLFQK